MNNIDENLFDLAVYQLSDMHKRCENLERDKAYLLNELNVACKGFAYHGLEGHAWLSQQAINHVKGGNNG